MEHLECWRHFALALRLLTKSKVIQDELSVADALFLQFGKRFEQLYDRESVTPDIIYIVIWVAVLMTTVQSVNYGYFHSKI